MTQGRFSRSHTAFRATAALRWPPPASWKTRWTLFLAYMTGVLHGNLASRKSTVHAMLITLEVICVQQVPRAHSPRFFHLFIDCSYRSRRIATCDATFTSIRQLLACATPPCSTWFAGSPITGL